MRYALLLKPHANVRYRQSLEKLAVIETACMLHAWGMTNAEPRLETLAGESFVVFHADGMPDGLWRDLSNHSAICLAAELAEGGMLKLLARTAAQGLPEDLPQVLKYKGKTNADFTAMMLHCAKAASDFAHESAPLTVLDPMCGKATTLFCALCEGHNGVGVDMDARALSEADTYFERSLKLHRFKHKRIGSSQTLSGGGNARAIDYTVSADAQAMRSGKVQTMRLLQGDAARLAEMQRPESCHLIVSDLPYGVQHAPKEGGGISTLPGLLRRVLPGCLRVLKRGGTAALSFNVNTLPRSMVEKTMREAGFEVLMQAPFNDFHHWVEQAVDRDVVIARKE